MTASNVCLEELKNKICKTCGYEGALSFSAQNADRLTVSGCGTHLSIGYASITDFCRAISLSIMKIREGEKEFSIDQRRRIETTGVMLDASYDGMLTVASLKEYIDYMAAMGLNLLMLYTEDTYEVKKYPQMGYQRGRYTKEEFAEIDAYARSMGVELIGCIQTLGHMKQVLKWADLADIAESPSLLLPGEEKTYEFIEECIKTISENITSRRIHVGLDEVFGLCEGKYKTLHGPSDPLEVYTDHVRRVYEICEKYGLKPMMWSDCFFRFCMKNPGYGIQYSATEPIRPEILAKVPSGIEMVYWEYEEQDENRYDAIIKAHAPLGGDCIMATATWCWDGQLPYADYIFKNQTAALRAAIKNGLKTAFATHWTAGSRSGDYFWSLPTLALYGQYGYEGADTSEEGIGKLLKNCTGMDLAVVRLFDVYHNPERFMFYFGEKYVDCPVMINTVGRTDNPAKVFMAASRAVRAYKNEKWNALYTFAADLLEFVSIKAELLNRLQPAYAAGDRAYLMRAENELVPHATALLKSLRLQVQTRWLSIQKPYGFGTLNAYYGAAIAEMEYTEARLSAYVSGKIPELEELKQKSLGFKYADPMKNDFRLI